MSIFKQLFCFILILIFGFFASKTEFIQKRFGKKIASKGKRSGVRTIKVLAEPLRALSNDQLFEAVGTGKARLSAEIYPAVSEEVVKVLFKTQDRVIKGQLLVQLDDRDEQIALRLAKVKYRDAKTTWERYTKVVPQGAVSQTDLDSAKAAHDTALIEIDQVKRAIEDRKILAPFDGVVGIPNVDPGDRVTPSTMITGLDDRKILHLDFEVPEALAGSLQTQDTKKITAITPAFPSLTFHAVLAAQESRIDPRRRTLLARAQIDNSEDFLRPGMSFHTRWEIQGKDSPAAPEISLQWSREGSFIWVVRGSKARKVDVQVVGRRQSMVLLGGALSIGEFVVVEGLQRLRDGLKVEVLGASK